MIEIDRKFPIGVTESSSVPWEGAGGLQQPLLSSYYFLIKHFCWSIICCYIILVEQRFKKKFLCVIHPLCKKYGMPIAEVLGMKSNKMNVKNSALIFGVPIILVFSVIFVLYGYSALRIFLDFSKFWLA